MSEKVKFDPDKLLNGVKLNFSQTSNAGVMPVLQSFLTKIVSNKLEDINDKSKFYAVYSLYISSTSEPYYAHKEGGPHRRGLAIDISAINGKSITKYYGVDSEVTGICDALQYLSIDCPEVWENFGPLMCFKTRNGVINQIKKDINLINMHKSHLHFSVQG